MCEIEKSFCEIGKSLREIRKSLYRQLQKRERTGTSFLNISTEMLLNEKLPSQVKEFSGENCSNGRLAKVTKFHTNPYNFVACLPNPYKLTILGNI